MTTPCIFCTQISKRLLENDTCFAFFDAFPVSIGHLLIVPKKHRKDYFQLTQKEKKDMDELIKKGREFLAHHYQPDGYNIGFNCGHAAGQSVFHCHCHLIPRYNGDTPEPKGGIRGAIPHKMNYLLDVPTSEDTNETPCSW